MRTHASTVFQKYSPKYGVLQGEYPIGTQEDIEKALSQSRQVLALWQATPFKIRRRLLEKAARLIQQRAATFAALIHQETGKSLKDCYEGDLACAVSILTYMATIGPKILEPRFLPLDKSILMGRVHREVRVPRGVVGIISPWNYPFAIPISGIAASLMGGNTVLLKPSEHTPETGLAVLRLFQEVLQEEGLPAEILQVILGDGTTGAAMAQSGLDFMIFTGGIHAGNQVRQSMQAQGKEVSLELGGSDAMLVLPGANIDTITSYALWGRFSNMGQACGAVKRLLVPAPLYQQTIQQLFTKMTTFFQSPENQAPLITPHHCQRLAEQVDDALQTGAKAWVVEADINSENPCYYPPTLLHDISFTARVWTEEVFGPVLPVVEYHTVEEGIQLANETAYGLGASVFGPRAMAQQVAQQLQAGVVCVNDVPLLNYALPSIPWSGWKASGPGSSHGVESLREVTQRKTITENWLIHLPLFRKQPWHFNKVVPPDSLTLGQNILHYFATQRWQDKLNPKLWLALWQNRSSYKL